MNKFEKNLQMLEDNKLCESCSHYAYHNEYHSFGLCKRYNQNVTPYYSCNSFLPYASDFVSKKQMSTKDPVNPNHYKQGKVECIDAIESATVNKTGLEAVCVANVIKYLWRYEEKNGLEDIKKCQWYLNRLLEVLENNE